MRRKLPKKEGTIFPTCYTKEGGGTNSRIERSIERKTEYEEEKIASRRKKFTKSREVWKGSSIPPEGRVGAPGRATFVRKRQKFGKEMEGSPFAEKGRKSEKGSRTFKRVSTLRKKVIVVPIEEQERLEKEKSVPPLG